MMNLDDLKDQLREQWRTLWDRIQESPTYNNLYEQYQTWPPLAQKAAVLACGFLVVLAILSVPFSHLETAQQSIEEFNDERTLLRELLRVGRAAKDPPPLPKGLSASELQTRIQGFAGEFKLLPEQILGIQPLGQRPAGALSPPVIQQEGVSVSLAKLNLYQILDIGFRLQTLSPGVKVTSLEIRADPEDNHYYNTIFKVVSFSLPDLEGSTADARHKSASPFNKEKSL